jgi:hypothetical protein
MQWRDAIDRYGALPQRGGLKDYEPDGSWLQEKKLSSFHEERLEILQEERVQKKFVIMFFLCFVNKFNALKCPI